MAHICREYAVADDLVCHWKQVFLERAPELFRLSCCAEWWPWREVTYYYEPCEPGDLDLRAKIEEIALEFPRYGYRRMTAELKRRAFLVNHKRVLRLMREGCLLVHVRQYCRSTTNSRHGYGRYPNLIKRLSIVRPDQVWCADLTYIRLEREFVYLAVVLDVFTRAIRGWELGRQLTEELSKAALERALEIHRPEIHHSDQGVQYAATGYIQLLEAAGVQVSMAAVGRPTENAYVERVMRTLKEEEVYLQPLRDERVFGCRVRGQSVCHSSCRGLGTLKGNPP